VRHALRRVHLWLGLALSLLLFVFAVTGGALVYKEAYWRLVYPELRVPAAEITAAEHAAAIAAAREQFGEELRTVKLPEPGVPAYHLYLADGEAFLAVGDHHLIDRWRPLDRPMGFLFDLHAHLMAGERGEQVGGVVSFLGFLLAATGLGLWWPTRRRFSVKNVVPRDLSRRALLLLHRDVGALLSPILLVLLLSGSGLVFYGVAQKILNGMFGDAVPVASEPSGPVDLSGTLADATVVAGAEAAFPGSRLVFYYPPREGATVHEFRIKQPCEVHPNGRSYAYLDGQGNLLGRTDACALPNGERAVHALYPLHSGKTESGTYKLLVLLGAVALAILSTSGALTYSKGLRRS
jgi:uncharacterized iron-regulated membrane protein